MKITFTDLSRQQELHLEVINPNNMDDDDYCTLCGHMPIIRFEDDRMVFDMCVSCAEFVAQSIIACVKAAKTTLPKGND